MEVKWSFINKREICSKRKIMQNDEQVSFVCKILLLARRTQPAGHARRATIGYLVYKIPYRRAWPTGCIGSAFKPSASREQRYLAYNRVSCIQKLAMSILIDIFYYHKSTCNFAVMCVSCLCIL